MLCDDVWPSFLVSVAFVILHELVVALKTIWEATVAYLTYLLLSILIPIQILEEQILFCACLLEQLWVLFWLV